VRSSSKSSSILSRLPRFKKFETRELVINQPETSTIVDERRKKKKKIFGLSGLPTPDLHQVVVLVLLRARPSSNVVARSLPFSSVCLELHCIPFISFLLELHYLLSSSTPSSRMVRPRTIPVVGWTGGVLSGRSGW
jgi:hypothetical protein